MEGEDEGHQARQAKGHVNEDEEDAYGLAGVASSDGLQGHARIRAEGVEEEAQEGDGG